MRGVITPHICSKFKSLGLPLTSSFYLVVYCLATKKKQKKKNANAHISREENSVAWNRIIFERYLRRVAKLSSYGRDGQSLG